MISVIYYNPDKLMVIFNAWFSFRNISMPTVLAQVMLPCREWDIVLVASNP